jgi:hypothetical protein
MLERVGRLNVPSCKQVYIHFRCSLLRILKSWMLAGFERMLWMMGKEN